MREKREEKKINKQRCSYEKRGEKKSESITVNDISLPFLCRGRCVNFGNDGGWRQRWRARLQGAAVKEKKMGGGGSGDGEGSSSSSRAGCSKPTLSIVLTVGRGSVIALP